MSQLHTKRPHHKTRSGCQSCKRRRVKCDERRPKCTSCTLRKIECEYIFTKNSSISAATPRKLATALTEADLYSVRSDDLSSDTTVGPPHSPPFLGYTPYASSTHLRLLHHYATVTTDTLNISEGDILNNVWRKEIPQLAFENDYLLNNLLATASMHLCQLKPESADYKTAGSLMNKALRSFRNAILTISPDTYLPILANAALLSPVSLVANRVSGQPLAILDWMRMHRGVGVLLGFVSRDVVMQSPIAPIYRIAAKTGQPAPIAIPILLQDLVDSISQDEDNAAYRDMIHRALLEVGKLYGGLALHRGELLYHVKVLRWPYDIPEDFAGYVREQRPHALVLLAHYVLFFEFLEFWWTSGVAKKEVETISSMLSDEWQPFIQVPQLVVQLQDQDKVVELMLSQLPVQDTTESPSLGPVLTVGGQSKFVRNESNILTTLDHYQAEFPD